MSRSEGPPTGRLSRAVTLGGAAVAAGAAEARRRLPGGSTSDDGAAVLFAALGRLKGTALKLAQMLSLETDLLPPRLADELARAHYRSPSLSYPTVLTVVQQELMGSPRGLYASFDRRAFAAASLGQVHAAIGHDGRELAVKIQYPGIGNAARADIRMMRSIVRRIPNSAFAHVALDEFAARLREELDYRREAAATRLFREALAPLGVAVPEIVDALSAEAVLTMTRLPGLHLDEWLATAPDQATTDSAAQRLWDVFCLGVRQLRHVHADTNLGNFLFGPGDAVGMVDFGCNQRLHPPTIDAREDLMRALLVDDEVAVVAAYRRLGVFGGAPDSVVASRRSAVLSDFERWLVHPFRTELFDFGADTTYCGAGRRAFHQLSSDGAGVRMPRDLVFVDRTQFGLYRLFSRMGARVALRGLVEESPTAASAAPERSSACSDTSA